MNTFTDNNLRVSGWNISLEYRSLIIRTDLPSLSIKAKDFIERDGFNLKDEAHITCIGSSVGGSLSDTQLEIVRVGMCEYTIDDVTLGDVLYRVAQPKVVDNQSFERESLIAPINSPSIERLLKNSSDKLGITIDQFLHITIATRPDNQYAKRGIGINSQAEFDAINQGECHL